MIPRVTATVDLDALVHNVGIVRRHAPSAKVMAAIKADAYGHGAVPVARALASRVDALAVACLEEALVLREAHVRSPIVLLEGVLSSEEARLALRHDLQVVVHDHWQLDALESLAEGAEARLWLKLDTGMNRLGFAVTNVDKLRQRLAARPAWKLQGWMTHLACADDASDDRTHRQVESFTSALSGQDGPRSIANSAGILAWPTTHADWVRPGLMLYGASPFADRAAAALDLWPVMQLDTRLIAIRDCRAGDALGYGAAWRCPEPMRVGIAAIGYADGLHRAIATGTPVRIGTAEAPVVGRVSMDMLHLDLRRAPAAAVGDTVRLWGDAPTVDAIAVATGTLSYELLCGLTRRVRFRYVGGEDAG